MPSIINFYRERAPESRFIGLRYLETDRADGGFSGQWEDWFAQRRFKALEPMVTQEWLDAFPEAGSYIGLMKMSEKEPFQYWIGMFLPPDVPVPDGYRHLDLPATELGVCWVKGKEPEIFWQCEACLGRLKEEGADLAKDADGTWWSMERYQCPRFTEADENGDKILDLVFQVQGAGQGREEEAASPDRNHYCGKCYAAFEGERCPECGRASVALQPDDPIFMGEMPSALRNALQIAFAATEIPFTAMPTLGSGFTLAAGDIFETYKLYVPYERSAEAQEKLEGLFKQYRADE